jgi:hypothetical protein
MTQSGHRVAGKENPSAYCEQDVENRECQQQMRKYAGQRHGDERGTKINRSMTEAATTCLSQNGPRIRKASRLQRP